MPALYDSASSTLHSSRPLLRARPDQPTGDGVVVFAVHPVRPQGTTVTSPSLTVAIVIPARYHSTRLPGKPLADIEGRPMIEHVYRRAMKVSRAATVIVATDDERVQTAVREFGGNAQLTDRAHRNGTERSAEVARSLPYDLVVNLQGDEPLIDPKAIEKAVSAFDDAPDVMMSTLRVPLGDPVAFADPHVVKVVVDRSGYALYFSRAMVPGGGSETGPRFKHAGLYVYRREFLLRLAQLEPTALEEAESLEQLRALEHGYRIMTVESTHDPIGVDTPDDLERVRHLLAAAAAGESGAAGAPS